MRRPSSQQKMTPLQQTWLARIVVFLFLCGLSWLVFAPGSGLLALSSKRGEMKTLQKEIEHLKADNAQLQQEIDRMKNDPSHLEEVARRDFGLLKTNERVYDFSKQQEKQE